MTRNDLDRILLSPQSWGVDSGKLAHTFDIGQTGKADPCGLISDPGCYRLRQNRCSHKDYNLNIPSYFYSQYHPKDFRGVNHPSSQPVVVALNNSPWKDIISPREI